MKSIFLTTNKVEAEAPNTSFPKQERLCGKTAIARLLAEGRHGSIAGMRFLYLAENGKEHARLMISVPKKNFKRAVKRNLLKRRIRESWRRQKNLLQTETGVDILIMYTTKEIMPYEQIYQSVGQVLEKINSRMNSQKENCENVE